MENKYLDRETQLIEDNEDLKRKYDECFQGKNELKE